MKLVVIVPHKDREDYIAFQKEYLTDYLSKRRIDHKVVFVEQRSSELFNKSITINVGFKYAWETFKPDYIVLNDADMVPLNLDYRYLGIAEAWFGTAGGIKLLSEDFIKVNGFNINFSGWGYEDSEFWHRLRVLKITDRLWHLHNPDGMLIDLETTATNTRQFSNTYYGLPKSPRIYSSSEHPLTSHIKTKYPKKWLLPEIKNKNAQLCQKIERLPDQDALAYFQETGLKQIDSLPIHVVSDTDTVAEIYWTN